MGGATKSVPVPIGRHLQHTSVISTQLPSIASQLSPALSSLGCLNRKAGSFHAANRSGSTTLGEEE